MNMIESVVDNEIMAIIPVYLDMKGNGTRIITRRGKDVFVFKRIQTVIRLISEYFTLDMRASRRYYGQFIGASNIVPIPFDGENIFVPIKMRRPISKNDGSFGYFNLRFIEKVDTKDKEVFIVLKNDVRIKCLQRFKSVKRHIKDGRVVEKMYGDKFKGVDFKGNMSFFDEYSKPATKGDIAEIRVQLMEIKEKVSSSGEKV